MRFNAVLRSSPTVLAFLFSVALVTAQQNGSSANGTTSPNVDRTAATKGAQNQKSSSTPKKSANRASSPRKQSPAAHGSTQPAATSKATSRGTGYGDPGPLTVHTFELPKFEPIRLPAFEPIRPIPLPTIEPIRPLPLPGYELRPSVAPLSVPIPTIQLTQTKPPDDAQCEESQRQERERISRDEEIRRVSFDLNNLQMQYQNAVIAAQESDRVANMEAFTARTAKGWVAGLAIAAQTAAIVASQQKRSEAQNLQFQITMAQSHLSSLQFSAVAPISPLEGCPAPVADAAGALGGAVTSQGDPISRIIVSKNDPTSARPPTESTVDLPLTRLQENHSDSQSSTQTPDKFLAQVQSPQIDRSQRQDNPEQPHLSPDFDVLVGDANTARRAAVVVYDGDSPAPGIAPSPYQMTLLFKVRTKIDDPLPETTRLRAALRTLNTPATRYDLWSEGLAGLIVRSAVEGLSSTDTAIGMVVLIDTPNRGLSTAGWPNWSAVSQQIPSYAVTAGSFLTELNSPAKISNFEYINIWRMRTNQSPRATTMQLPRAAWEVVARAEGERSIWTLIEAPIVAVRKTPTGGPKARSQADGPTTREQELKTYGPIRAKGATPSVRTLLDNSLPLPTEAIDRWLQYEDPSVARKKNEDSFSRMTDPVRIVYQQSTGRLIVVGYEDYLREPLSSDIFIGALKAFSGGFLAISIDPPSASDPPTRFPVRYEGVASSRLGGVMFEVDRVTKSLSLGRDNISGTIIGSNVPGYRSLAAELANDSNPNQTVWRLWFQPKRWHAREVTTYSAILDTRMECLWEKMTPTYAPSQAVTQFTAGLTQRYSEYAQEQPSLDQLDQVAAVVAAARWAYDANLDLPAQSKVLQSFNTPTYTPLAEVRTRTVSDQYEITHVLQGGVILGQQLRHVRERSGIAGALRSQSQAQQYPGDAQLLSHLPLQANSWGYTSDTVVMQAVSMRSITRSSGRQVGILRVSDSINDPAITPGEGRTLQEIFPSNRPLITDVSIDDAAEPPQITMRGTSFGASAGTAIMNNREIPTKSWKTDEVIVNISEVTSGTLQLKTNLGYSNPVGITLIPGVPRKDPPAITITNHTNFSLRVVFTAIGAGGSRREFDIPPGGSERTKVLPGKYSVSAQSSAALTIAATSGEKAFERGHTYSLTYEQGDFPSLGTVTVNNYTGSPISMNLTGPVTRVLAVPSGVGSTIRLPFGTYSLSVSSSCGTASRSLNVSVGSTNALEYRCQQIR